MKIHIWADSPYGSIIRDTCSVETFFELSKKEWMALNEEEKECLVREIVFDRISWGYDEITEEQE